MDKSKIMVSDANMKPIPVLVIGDAKDITNSTCISRCKVIRICSATECRVWNYMETADKSGTGLLMPEGSVEYFHVKEGSIIEVQGSANITEEL